MQTTFRTLFLSQACGPLYSALKHMLAQNTCLSHGGRENPLVKCTILGATNIKAVERHDWLPIVASDKKFSAPWMEVAVTNI